MSILGKYDIPNLSIISHENEILSQSGVRLNTHTPQPESAQCALGCAVKLKRPLVTHSDYCIFTLKIQTIG